MGSIQEDILKEFFEKLSDLPDFDAERLEALRALFNPPKRPKAAALVEALSSEPKDQIP